MISIIICCNDKEKFDSFCYPVLHESSELLKKVGMPPLDIIFITNPKSIFIGYNQGIKQAKHQIKVFLHQDVNLLDPTWVFKILKAFAEHPEYGLIGFAGTTKLPKRGFWWEEGKEYLVGELFSGNEKADWTFKPIKDLTQVECIDSYFMSTNKSIPFDENCEGYHLVDMDYSKTISSLGLKVGIVPHKAWHIGAIRSQDTTKYLVAHYNKWDENSLFNLTKKYPSDKLEHGFLSAYEKHFEPLRDSVKYLLEIGVHKGYSHLLWKEYFKNAKIYAIDNLELNATRLAIPDLHTKINVGIANQENRDELTTVLNKFSTADLNSSNFDIIIDDGGHKMDQQQISLGKLFPKLKAGGIYVIEDLHTSFMPNAGINATKSNTTYKMLTDYINTKKISSEYLTSEELDYLNLTIQDCEILHTKNNNEHITSIIKKRPNIPLNISVVYFAYLNPDRNWQTVIISQLNQLKSTGLEAVADINIVLSGEPASTKEATQFIKTILPKAKITCGHTNQYEFQGIHLLWELANKNPEKIYLYFHTKGIVRGNGSRVPEERKLFDEVVCPWTKVIDIFNNSTVAKVGYASTKLGYMWFNFWWARGSYIIKCPEPAISSDRHYYEGWLKLRKDKEPNCDDCYSLAPNGGIGKSYGPSEAEIILHQNLEKYLF